MNGTDLNSSHLFSTELVSDYWVTERLISTVVVG